MQDIEDVAQKYDKICCDRTQFTLLQYFGPHIKPNGVQGLSKNYNM